ncbi:hypothetical protein ACGFJC_47680 [Nonomuraea fuscirosea]|uniref:hypothetical protein n=1 Tax=Nonomuraea fuscirosea TaxID=1291556 RepID=UPI00371BC232
MSDYDQPGQDLPTDDMIQNWNEANDHADEHPHDEPDDEQPGNVASLLERQIERLAATLNDSLTRLDEHIEQRATELAAPRIAEADQRAAARERAAAAEVQRAHDLIAELRRHVAAADRTRNRLIWLSQYLPDPVRPYAGIGHNLASRIASDLPQEWRDAVTRAATQQQAPPDHVWETELWQEGNVRLGSSNGENIPTALSHIRSAVRTAAASSKHWWLHVRGPHGVNTTFRTLEGYEAAATATTWHQVRDAYWAEIKQPDRPGDTSTPRP